MKPGLTDQVHESVLMENIRRPKNLHKTVPLKGGYQEMFPFFFHTQNQMPSSTLPAITEPSVSPLAATDSTVDSEDEEEEDDDDNRDDSELDDWELRPPQPFTPQHLCECRITL